MLCHASLGSILIICTCYVVFAAQVFFQAPKDAIKTPGGQALAALIVVFVLCAFSGYGSTMFGQIPGLCLVKTPSWYVREAFHWILATASLWLVISNQARFIARLLVDD